MQVTRYELETGRTKTQGQQAPSQEAHATVRASADKASDPDPRSGDTPEEPGYGHGV